MLAIFYVWYNFCRAHHSLKNPYSRSPAMVAGLAENVQDMEWLVGLVDANAPPPGHEGRTKRRL